MLRKLTQEEVRKFCESLGYEVININDYKDVNTILYLKDKEGYIYKTRYNCLEIKKIPNKFHKNNLYTIQNIKLWIKTNAVGYELLSTVYKDATSELEFKCPEGHKFEANWNSFQQGHRCPYCSNTKVLKGYNDIATTDTWMIELGVSIEDAEKYMKSSGKKITVTCPNCKKLKQIAPYNIYKTKSIGCSCGDGTSYPEKFIISLLDQLGINYQHDSYWIENKRYDFYFEYNGNKYVLECHGGQHYKDSFSTCGGRSLKEEQKNDRHKKDLALDNGVKHYIELDCRESTLEQIKNSVLNSELSYLFDLTSIDWSQCEKFAINSNKIKTVCDYWHLHNEINNENLTTSDIGKVFNLNRHTIVRYLNRGVKLGWCNYDAKKVKSKASCKVGKSKGKSVEVFKDGKSLGIFPSCCELERQSEELFGVKLLNNMISKVCNNKIKQYKGFIFKYIK